MHLWQIVNGHKEREHWEQELSTHRQQRNVAAVTYLTWKMQAYYKVCIRTHRSMGEDSSEGRFMRIACQSSSGGALLNHIDSACFTRIVASGTPDTVLLSSKPRARSERESLRIVHRDRPYCICPSGQGEASRGFCVSRPEPSPSSNRTCSSTRIMFLICGQSRP
jgi:hypothetical protein